MEIQLRSCLWNFHPNIGPLLGANLARHRQALDSPAISTDDHLKFQGLDASAGAQLMEAKSGWFWD